MEKNLNKMTEQKQIENLFKEKKSNDLRGADVKEGDKLIKKIGNFFSNVYLETVSSMELYMGVKALESKVIEVKPENQPSSQVQSNLNEIQINGKDELRMFGNHEAFNPSGTYSGKNYSNNQGNSIPLHEVYGRGV